MGAFSVTALLGAPVFAAGSSTARSSAEAAEPTKQVPADAAKDALDISQLGSGQPRRE